MGCYIDDTTAKTVAMMGIKWLTDYGCERVPSPDGKRVWDTIVEKGEIDKGKEDGVRVFELTKAIRLLEPSITGTISLSIRVEKCEPATQEYWLSKAENGL